MRRLLLPTALLLASQLHAGRAATYLLSDKGVDQRLTIKRETTDLISFTLVTECVKKRCKDSLAGEARMDPFKNHPGSSVKGDWAAEEYVYRKGKCRIGFRVDMESGTMVKVLPSCPERDTKKCPLKLDGVLKLKR